MTLDREGAWYFWTESVDVPNVFAGTPDWQNGFKMIVRKGGAASANHLPVATVSVDGHASGEIIGSSTVTVHFKATDADNNLYGIRYNVWYSNTNTQDNNGGNFAPVSGGIGEVVKTVTLNQDGDWYFWTDVQDNEANYANSPCWTSGFKLTVSQAGVLRGDYQTDTLFAQGYPSGLGNSDYVKLIYRGMLRREADSGGLTTFLNALNAGALTHATMVDSILGSQEFKLFVGPVARLYFGALRRVPDTGGLDRVNYLRAGNSLDSMGNAFSNCQEFLNRYGTLNNQDYVAQLYRDFLQREATSTELAGLKGLLDAGTETRGQILVYVSGLQDSINLYTWEVRTVLDFFTFLNRAPSQTELASWQSYLGVLP